MFGLLVGVVDDDVVFDVFEVGLDVDGVFVEDVDVGDLDFFDDVGVVLLGFFGECLGGVGWVGFVVLWESDCAGEVVGVDYWVLFVGLFWGE